MLISHSLHKVYFAGNNGRSQEWNIICSPLSISISCYLPIQQVKISFSAHHQGVNDILALKSIAASSFYDCQKHEDILVKKLQRDEDIIVSSLSLYYTWHNDLHLFNHMILTIIIINFIYLGIVTIWDS